MRSNFFLFCQMIIFMIKILFFKNNNITIDAFKLWCWIRLLRVPWTARRSNQSVLKEINPEYSLKGLMLKLKLQYFGYLMRRADSLEKTLMLGKIEGRRRRGWLSSFTFIKRLFSSSYLSAIRVVSIAYLRL